MEKKIEDKYCMSYVCKKNQCINLHTSAQNTINYHVLHRLFDETMFKVQSIILGNYLNIKS